MTSRTGWILVGTIVVLLVVFYVWASSPAPGGGAKFTPVPDTILGDGTTPCLLSPMPVSTDTDDVVDWSQERGRSYTIAFPGGSALDPGTPFLNKPGGSRQTNFPSPGTPLRTGPISRTNFQKYILNRHEFPIQSIVVNGQPCYDANTHAIPGMKVIVNQ